ncbi:hypothetical protein MBANPS3_008741 [Mucor bainieri]
MPTIHQFPTELLVKILDYNDSIADLAQCRLVCQHWNPLAESLMFGKHITLKSAEACLSLYGHLSRKPQYGQLIKRLTCEKLSPQRCQHAILEELLRVAFTPTMEQMDATVCLATGDRFFILMQDMLTVKYRLDQFDKLAVIPHPSYYSEAYDNLLITLSSTLQRVVIKLTGPRSSQNRRHLFESLSTFKRLTSLDLRGLMESFRMMETILSGCSLLEDVAVDIHLQENMRTKLDMTTWMIANEIKVEQNSIKSLKVVDSCRADLLELFVHKYRNIKSIVIEARQAMSRMREDMKLKLIVEQDALLHAINELFTVGLLEYTLKQQNGDQFRIEINSP